jgi:threonine dehydrogenase-like Zn-dependent dehydrogenase
LRGFFRDSISTRLRADLPIPNPLPGEILLKVVAAGICDTDIQLARGYMNFQGILGHEFVGRDPSGNRVTAEINNACQNCEACRKGLANHCPNRSVLGILKHDGAMADWVAVPESNVHRIPDSIDDRSAVFIEPLAAAFQILEQVDISPTDSIAVLGDGKLGILCARTLLPHANEVRLIGKHPEKLARAGEGIETSTLEEQAHSWRRYDVVVDATGSTTGLEAALGLVRPRGTVVLKTTVAGQYEIDLARIVIDEIRVVGSRCGPFPKAIEALASKTIEVASLIEAEFPFDEADRAFAAAGRKGALKILLKMS